MKKILVTDELYKELLDKDDLRMELIEDDNSEELDLFLDVFYTLNLLEPTIGNVKTRIPLRLCFFDHYKEADDSIQKIWSTYLKELNAHGLLFRSPAEAIRAWDRMIQK